jgi:hypothetical protein
MLKAKVTPHGVEFEVEANTQKEMFKAIANLQEVFSEKVCGLCKSDVLRFVVRTIDENDYFELHCESCNGKLAYGQNKKGGQLFPIRKLTESGKPSRKEGKYDVKGRGWTKYRGESKEED